MGKCQIHGHQLPPTSHQSFHHAGHVSPGPRIHAAILVHQLALLALAAEALLEAAEIHGQQDLVVLVVSGTLAGQQGVAADLLWPVHRPWDVWSEQ